MRVQTTARKPLFKKVILFNLILTCSLPVFAQHQTVNFSTIQSGMDSDRLRMPGEKIYLQFDRASYLPGDTIWFKVYLFNASFLSPTTQSGILYIDVAGDDNKVLTQFKLPVAAGETWGNIALAKEIYTEGNYTIRAYTNWLRNFGDGHYFYHRFTIAGAKQNSVLVNTRTQVFNVNGNDSVRTLLQFTGLDKQPIANRQLQLHVSSGAKKLFKSAVTTTPSGVVDVNFTLSGKPMQVVIAAEDKNNPGKIVIPLSLTTPANIDVQFMPEGGELIAGLPAHVAFKAIGEDGRSVDVKGVVVNSSATQVAAFASTHKGMGAFDITPAAGETYTAKITLPGGGIKSYLLPAVKPDGITLHVINTLNDDSLQVSVATTPGFAQAAQNVLLVAQAGDVFCYGTVLHLNNKVTLNHIIAKSLFPTGIARVTVVTTEGQPLCQRLTFITAKDSVRIKINGGDTYSPRDSIAIELSVTDQDNKPVKSFLSLAVTDDAQVSNDKNKQNIMSYIMLSADLKGYVEEPAYYLQLSNSDAWQALDNLLLTQGWAGYSWQPAIIAKARRFEPEHDFRVSGKVTNIFNKGLAHTGIMLLSKKPGLLIDTVTDNNGRFVFTNFPALDTPNFVIQARNKKGGSFNVGVDVDVMPPPAFTTPPTAPLIPWYINTDTALLALTNTRQELNKKFSEGLTLAPVIVYAKKTVASSQNLNGSGNADVVLNEGDMFKADKKSLLDLLNENAKNFYVKTIPKTTFRAYYIGSQYVFFIFDGVLLNDVYSFGSFEEEEAYLKRISAEDIKGIEVMSSGKYVLSYASRYFPMANPFVLAFIEITTYGSSGPVVPHIPGMYYYHSQPFQWPATFYSPRYTVKDTSDHTPDMRTTIFWKPNIITGADGKATVTFYAADTATTYTVTVEGTNFDGYVATKTKKIKIEGKK